LTFVNIAILFSIRQVESVAFDIDYRGKISRSTFEEALGDLKPLFTKPILDALSKAELTLVGSIYA
jgi:hypoxia up-regulated 1